MSSDSAATLENVRLLIWDLDETFWDGTLTEGGITLVPQNIAIMKMLPERGIINSVCSKNDHGHARIELERAGVWDQIVFPRIAWEAKGAMVRDIIASAQLRATSVMFIDDNPINLNEVCHYNPGIQIAEPIFLASLLLDPRFHGKPDPERKRLAQYKLLEKKERDKEIYSGQDQDFLKSSQIQISFHHNILEEFDRVYDLINRTNQLNFTKRRLSENKEEARAQLESLLRKGGRVQPAYIKASDKYGYYGVIGFYMTHVSEKGRQVDHFLFSCRTLNMGIEQHVYKLISRPKFDVCGEVVSRLDRPNNVDWITVVPDAETREDRPSDTFLSLCMRGGCDLDQLIHYLGHRYNVAREFPYPSRGWVVSTPAAQFTSAWSFLAQPQHKELLERIPGLHFRALQSKLLSNQDFVFVMSFAAEYQLSHYRFRPTGLVLPFRWGGTIDDMIGDVTRLKHSDAIRILKIDFDEIEWEWFRKNFEHVGGFDPTRFGENMRDLRSYLMGRRAIIIHQNTRHGNDSAGLSENACINNIAERELAGHASFISLDEIITGPDDVIDAHHLRRPVFLRLADKVNSQLKGLVK